MLDNALLKDSKAFKNNQVIYLDSSSYLASGGYQQMLRELTLLREAVTSAQNKAQSTSQHTALSSEQSALQASSNN